MTEFFEEAKIPQEHLERKRRRKSSMLEWFKNLLTLILLLVIVVGSFWISFVLGKKILLPVKKISVSSSMLDIPKTALTPEKVEAAKPIKKEDLVVVAPPSVNVETQAEVTPVPNPVPAPLPKPMPKPKTREKAQISVKQGYYKLSAGVFSSKDAAKNLAAKLEEKNIPVYVRQLDNGKWRVQVGAFKKKSEAEAAGEKIKGQGFEINILRE